MLAGFPPFQSTLPMSHPNLLRSLSFLAFLLLAACSPATPDPEAILAASLAKCQTVENGYYEMAHRVKYMTGADTMETVYECFFEKTPDDPIYPSNFRHRVSENGEYLRDVLYNGDEFIRFSTEDSTGARMSKERWAEELESYTHNHSSHAPFTDRAGFPLQHDSIYLTRELDYRLLEEDLVHGVPSYHIRMTVRPLQPDTSEMLRTYRTERNYWVSIADSIPMQYSIEYGLVMAGDTMTQFEMNTLTSYRLNDLKRADVFELSSIPAHIRLKEFTPQRAPQLLQTGIPAPAWTLRRSDGTSISLADHRGQLLLVDFRYRSCSSCEEADPQLSRLQRTYGDRGLQVIGIDPTGDATPDLAMIDPAEPQPDHPIYSTDFDLAEAYRVAGYPTFYLIGRDGKILYAHLGYDESTGKELDRIIEENL